VIAAAGNDHRPGQSVAPQARVPAAFDSVQGVGALPKALPRKNGKLKKASYSNQADKPRKIGITTLGGEEGEGQGVLGLYLGEFPCGEPNCTKWAWWAGTSFATPVVTGVTVAVLSNMIGTDRQTQVAIERLYYPGQNINKIVLDGDVEQEEDGLSMIQI
jgi:subtilisin family serine protease